MVNFGLRGWEIIRINAEAITDKKDGYVERDAFH
jgi:hypothetical protein